MLKMELASCSNFALEKLFKSSREPLVARYEMALRVFECLSDCKTIAKNFARVGSDDTIGLPKHMQAWGWDRWREEGLQISSVGSETANKNREAEQGWIRSTKNRSHCGSKHGGYIAVQDRTNEGDTLEKSQELHQTDPGESEMYPAFSGLYLIKIIRFLKISYLFPTYGREMLQTVLPAVVNISIRTHFPPSSSISFVLSS